MKVVWWSLVAMLAPGLVACSGDDGGPPATTTTTDSAAVADAALPTAADVPAAWEGFVADASDAALAESCPDVAGARAEVDDVAAPARAAMGFRDPTTGVPSLRAEAWVYRDAADAERAFASRADRASFECVSAALVEAYAAEGGTVESLTVDETSPGRLGDEAAGAVVSFRVVSDGVPIDGRLEVVVLRAGTVVESVLLTASEEFPLEASRRDALLEALATRVVDAAADATPVDPTTTG